MKAVILVAGVSRRLYPSTKDLPKCLLPVAGSTILEYQLSTLQEAGIRDITLVLGYRREQIIEVAQSGFPGINFTFIVNHHFFETNTAYSLWLAGEQFKGHDFYYLNGDVLYVPELIKRLEQSGFANSLAVEVKTCGDEEVKVITDGEGRVRDIGKEIDPRVALGEFIGVAKFSRDITVAFHEALSEIVSAGLNSAYFEFALKQIAGSHALNAVDVSDLPCIEVDFPEDLEKAREMAALIKSTS